MLREHSDTYEYRVAVPMLIPFAASVRFHLDATESDDSLQSKF